MTIPMPADAEYPLSDSADLKLVLMAGVAFFDFAGCGGYDTIDSAEQAVEAGRALLYWATWKREQDVIAWLAAEDQHRKDLRRLGLYNKGRIGRGA